MELPQYLTSEGYRQIPLQRSEVGYFHVSATLRGHAVSVLVDTGADCTLVSLGLARALDLPMSMLPDKASGAGNAAIDMYVVDGVSLDFAELAIRPRMLLAMDLSHANEALVQKGAAPIEAIVGLDVFEQHAAVIDYGSQSLFLRP